ncbi:MAG: PEGA domain-containing protein [Verrucomicrobia bacterium]|nr:PEGA domain-containing protein [Verrucomicrobiota bacterium]
MKLASHPQIGRFAINATLAIALTSCSAFQPARQDVTVNTTTPGATIKANGVTVGTSPVTFSAKRNQDLNLVATKPGYQASVMQISRQTSGTFALDLIGGWFLLLPWIGLLTPGAYELSSTQVEMPLNKAN